MELVQYKRIADGVANVMDWVLANELSLSTPAKYYLVNKGDSAWLIAEMDTLALGKNISAYLHPDVAKHLSAVLNRMPVFVSAKAGLHCSVLLSGRPRLPDFVQYPGWKRGIVQLGMMANGKALEMKWDELGHVLIAGMTQQGKSNLLRLLVLQARDEGIKLMLADDGRTFGKFQGDEALLHPVVTALEKCYEIVDKANSEIIRRGRLFDTHPERPDSLGDYNAVADEPLPQVLVMLDEFSAMVSASGGSKSQFAQRITSVAWRGLKFGVQLVLSGQDFTKDTVGPVAEQMLTKIALKVMKGSTSRVVLGRNGAEHLRRPGQALTNRSSMLQLYFVGDDEISPVQSSGMSADEERLAKYLLDLYGGKVDLHAIKEHNDVGERQARNLRNDWIERGLAEKRADQNNAIVLTIGLDDLKSAQTSKPPKPVQTVSKRPSERPNDVQAT